MSNKKRISKKANSNSFLSLKNEFAKRLFLKDIEIAMLRAQMAIVQSQPRKPLNYPSGVNQSTNGIKIRNTELIGESGKPEVLGYFEKDDGEKIYLSDLTKPSAKPKNL